MAAGNNGPAIFVDGDNNTIGSTTGLGNLVSGGNGTGVDLEGPNSDNNQIVGNLIGTDITGANDLGNASSGVVIVGGSNNTIGGATAGARNVISGNNQKGIEISDAAATGNVIRGNYIGTDKNGTGNVGNSSNGIFLDVGVSGTTIGGIAAGAGNTVAFNGTRFGGGGAGLVLSDLAGTGNRIESNAFFSNDGIGIDLRQDGVQTANDANDADSGPNRMQNFPVISRAEIDGNGDLIVDYLVDTATGNATYPLRVEFFEADSAASGEGKSFLASNTYATGDAQAVKTNVNLGNAAGLGIAPGDPIVATATDDAGNSSEFSAVVSAPAACSIPCVQFGSSGNDNLILRRNTAGDRFEIVDSTTGAVLGSASRTVTSNIVINTLDGNDTLTVDESNGLVDACGGIQYDGGPGQDSMKLVGSTSVAATYSVGPDAGSGAVTHRISAEIGGTQQDVRFHNLEPVIDLVPGSLTVNGTAADNAINVNVGPNSGTAAVGGAASGQVQIDNFESIEFASKTIVTIDARANSVGGLDLIIVEGSPLEDTGTLKSGEITVNGQKIVLLAHDQIAVHLGDGDDVLTVHPSATVGMSVYGGDPSASDVLNVAGSGEADVALSLPHPINGISGLQEAGGRPVFASGFEQVNVAAGNQSVAIAGTQFDDEISYTPLKASGLDFAAVSRAGVNTQFLLANAASITLDPVGGLDTVIVNGNVADNTIDVVEGADQPGRDLTIDASTNSSGFDGQINLVNADFRGTSPNVMLNDIKLDNRGLNSMSGTADKILMPVLPINTQGTSGDSPSVVVVGKMELPASLTITSPLGLIDLSQAQIGGDSLGRSLTLAALGTGGANGSEVRLPDIVAMGLPAGQFPLQSLDADVTATAGGQPGNIIARDIILKNANALSPTSLKFAGNVSLPVTATFRTDSNSSNGGRIDLSKATFSASAANVSLMLDSSYFGGAAGFNGGQILLGGFSDNGGRERRVHHLTADSRSLAPSGGAGGNVTTHGPIDISGKMTVSSSSGASVTIDHSITAGSGVEIDPPDSIQVNSPIKTSPGDITLEALNLIDINADLGTLGLDVRLEAPRINLAGNIVTNGGNLTFDGDVVIDAASLVELSTSFFLQSAGDVLFLGPSLSADRLGRRIRIDTPAGSGILVGVTAGDINLPFVNAFGGALLTEVILNADGATTDGVIDLDLGIVLASNGPNDVASLTISGDVRLDGNTLLSTDGPGFGGQMRLLNANFSATTSGVNLTIDTPTTAATRATCSCSATRASWTMSTPPLVPTT